MGTTKWKSLKDADGKGGVRYREHPTQKHGAIPDRYYVLAYWWQGKTVTEKIGWSSEGWTPTKCFNLLAELRRNQSTGKGPCTLTEMRQEANQKRERAKKEADAQAKLDIPFKKFFDNDFMPDAETRWKPETARKAKEHVTNWINPVTGETPLKEIGLQHVQKIRASLAAKKRSPRHQQYVFRTFAMVWDAARDHGLVDGPSPTKSKSFRLPKIDNERQRYLSHDEEKKLLDEIKGRSEAVHTMAIISLDTGLRFSEIARLTYSCVDKDNKTLVVLNTKGKKDRNVPMTARLKGILESMAEGKPNELLFPTKEGKKQQQIPSSFVRSLTKMELNKDVENSKMRVSFHTLRHTYASRLVQAGVDLYRVQRLLGHSTPVMTARYSKLADDDLKKAVESMERAAEIKNGHSAKVVPLKKVHK